MSRMRPVTWAQALQAVFSPIRRKQRTSCLKVEQLDDRIVAEIIVGDHGYLTLRIARHPTYQTPEARRQAVYNRDI